MVGSGTFSKDTIVSNRSVVRVTPASGTLPGGSVQVYVGSLPLGTGSVSGNGDVQVSGAVNLPAGHYPVTAVYSGSGTYAGSRANDGPDLTVVSPPVPPPPPAYPGPELTLESPFDFHLGFFDRVF